MKKLFGAAVMISLLVAGCSDEASSNPQTTENAVVTQQAQTPQETQEPKKLTPEQEKEKLLDIYDDLNSTFIMINGNYEKQKATPNAQEWEQAQSDFSGKLNQVRAALAENFSIKTTSPENLKISMTMDEIAVTLDSALEEIKKQLNGEGVDPSKKIAEAEKKLTEIDSTLKK